MSVSIHRRATTAKRSSAARRFLRQQRYRSLRLETLEDRRVLATVNWDGGGDGQQWLDRFNWSNDTLPGSGDDVVIDVPGDITVRLSSGSVAVHSLVSQEALAI